MRKIYARYRDDLTKIDILDSDKKAIDLLDATGEFGEDLKYLAKYYPVDSNEYMVECDYDINPNNY